MLELEWFDGRQYDDHDHQDSRYLIDNSIEFCRIRVTVGGEFLDPVREGAVQHGHAEDQHEFDLEPDGSEPTALDDQAIPASQATIMAGVMIALSSRRSITLKVSDCTEPASAAQ